MTAVVLRPLGDATYAVLRNGVDTGVWVIGTYRGWDVERWPRTGAARPHRHFPLISVAREWLDSPAGQAFLDDPAAEVPR